MLLYVIYMAGLVLVFGDDAALFLKRSMKRRRLRRPGDDIGKLSARVREVYRATLPGQGKRSAFIALQTALFMAALVPGTRNLGIVKGIFAAAAVGASPFLILVTRLEEDRSRASREGISLVTEIYRQYRMCGRNIYEALQKAVDTGGTYPVCRKLIYTFLIRMRNAPGRQQQKDCVAGLSFALGTVWGKMLCSCIELSAMKGCDVSEGLADIAAQLKEASSRQQERKRLNGESLRMTAFLVPALYAGTMLTGVYYLEMSPGELLRNQFMTPEGFSFFLLCAFLFVFNMMILQLAGGSKLDY